MLMICSFPPPVHGQSLVNKYLLQDFRANFAQVDSCDISPADAGGLQYHMKRIGRVLRACTRLLKIERRVVYLSSESDYGVLYSMMLFAVARLRRRRTFLHHHVYSYLSERRRLHSILMRLAGASCTHIVLSPSMGTALQRAYPAVQRCVTLRNALFLPPALSAGPPPRPPRPHRLAVGFIGRLDAAKGFDDFLALIDGFASERGVRFIVAGDYVGSPYAAQLRTLQRELGERLDLRGFVSDDAKVRFFHEIDVLVFLSKYHNEASPLVCYEALANAVPVLVTRVGAVDDLIDDDCGRVFERTAELVPEMAAHLRNYLEHPEWRAERQSAAATRFHQLEQRARVELTELHALLAEDAPAVRLSPV